MSCCLVDRECPSSGTNFRNVWAPLRRQHKPSGSMSRQPIRPDALRTDVSVRVRTKVSGKGEWER